MAEHDANAHEEEDHAAGGDPSAPGSGGIGAASPGAGPAGNMREVELPATPDFEDRYPLLGTLGRGGMGVVTLRQDRVIGRQVAVKTAHTDAVLPGSAGATWRFIREARVQAQLEHPAVVPVYDLGRDPSGAIYFSMQRVRGQTLAEAIAGDVDEVSGMRLSRRRLIAILHQVALALDYAHHRGVVHRDLKPGNIMLGAYGEVFILDWGLARVTNSREPEPRAPSGVEPGSVDAGAGQTRGGETLGTPGYMAPEQIQDPGAVDHRADLYALGAILYEVLTGQPLHGASQLPTLLYRTMTCDGAEIPTEADVAPELAALIRDLTRLDPDDRPQDARAVADTLEAYLDGDRDARLRAAAAQRHLAQARAALASAGDDPQDEIDARRRALSEVGRALALVPDLEPARHLLVSLLTRPPRTLPPEAREAQDRGAQASLRMGARTAVAGYLSMALFAPITLWMGIRSWTAFALLASAMILCTAYTAFLLRHPPKDLQLPLPHLALTTATVALSSVMFGPLVLVPMLAVSNSVSYLSTMRHRQVWVIVAGVAALLVPATLQMVGILPQNTVVTGGVITLLPWMMAFPPIPTMAFLIATQTGIVIATGVFVLRLVRRATVAERAVLLQAWQLEQLAGPGSTGETIRS